MTTLDQDHLLVGGMNDILGGCTGIRFADRGDGHILIELLVEDDGNWGEQDFSISSFWLDDLISVCKLAKEALENEAEKEGSGFGYKFKRIEMDKDRKPGSYESGSDTCYQAEHRQYEIVDGVAQEKWERIEVRERPIGVPVSRHMGLLFSRFGYQSYEQAHALCWWYLAEWEARPLDRKNLLEARPKVRISVYDFTYDLKTYRRDEDTIMIDEAKNE